MGCRILEAIENRDAVEALFGDQDEFELEHEAAHFDVIAALSVR